MALLLRHPAKAAQAVCHEDQLVEWSSEMMGRLSMGGWLRNDMSYDDGIEMDRAIRDEIRCIVESAFTHPEAMKRTET